jgi:zinc transport system substrate-binding protein
MYLSKVMGAAFMAVLLSTGSASASLKAVTSIHPLAAIVREVGGDRVEVTTLVPAGSDPHHFELTPRKARAIHEADVVFLIGGQFDDWTMPGQGRDLDRPRIVRFYKDFSDSLINMGNTFNPHFWLDPLFARQMAGVVARTLCALDSAGCAFYRARALRFGTEMDSLNAAISKRLSEAGFKDFIAFHPAWSYFARRYGLNETGTIEMSDEQEPSARHIAEIVRKMTDMGIKIIIAEQFANTDLAEGVASQTGARVIYLDPLGGEDLPDRDTYAGLLDYNVSVIENALRKE